MARRSKAIRTFDFTGGLNTKSPVTTLKINEFLDGQNVNLLPSGGFEKRRGNTEFNASAMVDGTTAITGLGYYRQADQDDFLLAVAGTKLFKSDALDGTMDDVTGAITITADQDNTWMFTTFTDIIIGVGGAPDAPFKWTGTGNAAVLGGSPVSGRFGLKANRRMFIGSPDANKSTIYWSVLGDPEDWSGTGSGSQNVDENDGDTLVGATVLNIDHMLCFKQNSIHDLIIRNAPFPLFPLFRDVGAVSKRAILNVDGVVYFITPQPRMKATDGSRIITFPDTIDDQWDALNTGSNRLENIHGIYNQRLHQLWWFVSSGSSTTHERALVWDLKRNAWLKHPDGFSMNSSVLAQDRKIYCGAYDGKIYQMDVASTFADASESGGAIDAYVRTGWQDIHALTNTKYIPYADLSYVTQTVGNLQFSYGYNFIEDRRTESIDMRAPGAKWDVDLWDQALWGEQSDRNKLIHMKGMGKQIQFLIRQSAADEQLTFNGMEVPINVGAQAALK